MRVFVTGGTGLIGRQLVRKLTERGDQPIILSRRSDLVRRDPAMRSFEFVQGDPATRGDWESRLDGCDAVVNLVGHNVFSERWNAEVKRKIRDSRVDATENLVAALGRSRNRPKVLAQGSAIGYYGVHGDEDLTEESPSGTDFMAVVCREWEEAAHPAESLGVRVARIRTGIVLSREGGALGVMAPIFRMGGASPIGNGGSLFKPATGQQWMSWIHIDDIVGLFLLVLDRADASGPINGTSPHPARNADFSRALAKALHRPFIPFGPPDAVLDVMLGPVAQMITKGQKVLPTRAQALGYHFQFPELPDALSDVFAKRAATPQTKPVAAAHAHH